MNHKTSFAFIGRSGCGKGTQVKMLMDYLKSDRGLSDEDILRVETGKSFRDFIKENSYSSHLSKSLMDDAQKQPPFLAVWIWSNILINHLKEDQYLIFDGTPRCVIESQALDTALDFYNYDQKYVIHLRVSREWSREKLLSRGRVDDTSKDIEKRLDWYEDTVSKAVDHYRNNPDCVFLEIDGEQSIEKVHSDILAHI